MIFWQRIGVLHHHMWHHHHPHHQGLEPQHHVHHFHQGLLDRLDWLDLHHLPSAARDCCFISYLLITYLPHETTCTRLSSQNPPTPTRIFGSHSSTNIFGSPHSPQTAVQSASINTVNLFLHNHCIIFPILPEHKI